MGGTSETVSPCEVGLHPDSAGKKGEKFNAAVPTGNFGNILAAVYAKYMGVPIALMPPGDPIFHLSLCVYLTCSYGLPRWFSGKESTC